MILQKGGEGIRGDYISDIDVHIWRIKIICLPFNMEDAGHVIIVETVVVNVTITRLPCDTLVV